MVLKIKFRIAGTLLESETRIYPQKSEDRYPNMIPISTGMEMRNETKFRYDTAAYTGQFRALCVHTYIQSKAHCPWK
jgi:hypothetical protein